MGTGAPGMGKKMLPHIIKVKMSNPGSCVTNLWGKKKVWNIRKERENGQRFDQEILTRQIHRHYVLFLFVSFCFFLFLFVSFCFFLTNQSTLCVVLSCSFCSFLFFLVLSWSSCCFSSYQLGMLSSQNPKPMAPVWLVLNAPPVIIPISIMPIMMGAPKIF